MGTEKALTKVGDWDRNFEGFTPEVIDKVGFYEIYEEFLTPDPDKSVLEIGCGGGRHLCYLTKKYEHKPFGIDFSPKGIEKARATFEKNGLPEPTLHQADFFDWDPGRKFDLVMSHGFVEHFENFDLVMDKHAELVADGGLLIISMPHMAHLNYIFRWLVDREVLMDHNTRIMSLGAIRKALAPHPFEVLHLNYYKTFAFPPARQDLKAWQKVAYFIIYRTGRRIRKLVGTRRPNFLISPKIILAARRQGSG